jgi:hypothetical protein
MAFENLQRLMNVRELSSWINFPETRIRYLCFIKGIPFYKIGKSVRFDPDEILLWLKDQKSSPKQNRIMRQHYR